MKKKVRMLEGVVIEEVSLVKRGANNKRIFFAKSADIESKKDTESISQEGRLYIRKNSDGSDYAFIDNETGEKMHVLKCVLYEPDVGDLQGDAMTEQEIANAYYNYAMNSMDIRRDHSDESNFAKFVGGGIIPEDTEICGEKIKKGSAVIDIAVNDETFELYKSGEIDSVSMGGYFTNATEKEIEKTMDEQKEKVGLLKSLAKFLGFGDDIVVDNSNDDNSEELPINKNADSDNNDDNENNTGEEMTKEEVLAMQKELQKSIEEGIEQKGYVSADKYAELEKKYEESLEQIKAINEQIETIKKANSDNTAKISEIVEKSADPSVVAKSADTAKSNPIPTSWEDLVK